MAAVEALLDIPVWNLDHPGHGIGRQVLAEYKLLAATSLPQFYSRNVTRFVSKQNAVPTI